MTTERLAHLLALQDAARAEREDFVNQRVEIMRKAEEAGRSDLNTSEDAAFRTLTANIRDIDERLSANDANIRTLADLESLSVTEDLTEDEVTQKLAAAAEIYLGWRNATKSRARQDDAPEPRRNLTVAEARIVEKLDQP